MSVDFQIVNQKGKIINITATVDDDGKLYRCGKLIYCNCDKTNPEPYKYNKEYNEVYCPKCNKKSLHTIKNEGSNIHLDYIGLDENTMQKLYRLSDTLNHDTWLSVSKYFVKLSADDVDLNTNVSHVGWVTSNPEAVEDKLNIMQEWRIENRNIEDKTEDNVIKPNIPDVKVKDIVDKLYEVFSVVETPYGEFDLDDGLCVQNPLNPQNKYGSGECWIIRDEDIWYVRNNFRDGAKLEYNNVLIDGELLGIGRCIKYDDNVEDLILSLD